MLTLCIIPKKKSAANEQIQKSLGLSKPLVLYHKSLPTDS